MNRNFEKQLEYSNGAYGFEETCSMKGIGIKSMILLAATFVGLLVGKVGFSFLIDEAALSSALISLLIVAPVATLVIYLVVLFRHKSARVLSIPYAFLEGITIGVVGAILHLAFGSIGDAIVILSFGITVLVYLVTYGLYTAGKIKVGQKFNTFVLVGVLGIISVSLMGLIVNLITGGMVWAMLAAFDEMFPMLGLFFSLLMVVFAAMLVVSSIDRAGRYVQNGLKKEYEWYAAFGIIISLIYLYWRILRVLIKIVQIAGRRK